MLKLIVNYNRKLGEPNYGSRGAGVSLECELEAGLLRKPKQLRRTSRRLFALVRQWVEAELAHGRSLPQAPDNGNGENATGRPGESPSASSTGPLNGNCCPETAGALPITRPQMRAILRLAAQRGISWDRLLPEGRRLDKLTRHEASQLIDWLQRQPDRREFGSESVGCNSDGEGEPCLVGSSSQPPCSPSSPIHEPRNNGKDTST